MFWIFAFIFSSHFWAKFRVPILSWTSLSWFLRNNRLGESFVVYICPYTCKYWLCKKDGKNWLHDPRFGMIWTAIAALCIWGTEVLHLIETTGISRNPNSFGLNRVYAMGTLYLLPSNQSSLKVACISDFDFGEFWTLYLSISGEYLNPWTIQFHPCSSNNIIKPNIHLWIHF